MYSDVRVHFIWMSMSRNSPAKAMERCLKLAECGRGLVGNGALVGAVLVRDGQIIAEDYYPGWGKLHAERQLVQKFDQQIDSSDELYVNLEPCCHTGKTPPCTDIIIESGIKRVVYGMRDPDPRVSGQGIRRLQDAGITVEGPVIPAECARLNRGFVSLRTKSRPWITLKQARTGSGLVSNQDGSPLKITSAEQDEWSHLQLRSKHDAILVGVGTIERDDPQLNIRFVQSNAHIYRIILDPNFRILLKSKVVNGDLASKTIILVSAKGDNEKTEILEARGVRIFNVPSEDGRFVWEKLWKVLMTPVGEYHGITSILVEGGPKTWQAFRAAGLVDEETTLIGAD